MLSASGLAARQVQLLLIGQRQLQSREGSARNSCSLNAKQGLRELPPSPFFPREVAEMVGRAADPRDFLKDKFLTHSEDRCTCLVVNPDVAFGLEPGVGGQLARRDLDLQTNTSWCS